MSGPDKSSENCITSLEPYCHVKLDSILKLKDSTKQLLCLLEEIQIKTHAKNCVPEEKLRFADTIRSSLQKDGEESYVFDSGSLRKLEVHTKNLDAIYIEDDHDDCSVYKRLSRKCHCLNHPEYNDFVIHFNENSKYTTSAIGEIIKNMRILRKFLYMGGIYTRNALMFLNEGMMESSHSEKIEMAQACAHADVCNIFDDHSIVIMCISWPCKNKYYGDYVTQALAAGFLYKLAELYEGRRYLNYNSKITNDIKKVLRKKSPLIEVDTVDSLNATLNLLTPVFGNNVAITCFNTTIYEGVAKRTIDDLVNHRQYMTFEEVMIHLELLQNTIDYENGRKELMVHLPILLTLFKDLLMEYDNSEINIIVTSILNDILSKNMPDKKDDASKVLVGTSTQAIKMKSEVCQIPHNKASTRKNNKSKCGLGVSPNKFRQKSKRKVSECEPLTILNSRSKKFKNEHMANKSIIFVPLEK